MIFHIRGFVIWVQNTVIVRVTEHRQEQQLDNKEKMPLCSLHMKIENAVQPKRWWTASQGSPGRHAQGGAEDEAIPQMEVNSSLKQRTSSFAIVTQRLVNSQETCTTSLGASWIRYRTDRS